ncbi:hypothetical protein [Nocardia sp. NPDC048505]|uniref:hypothetical protein n=1 Tax=unclassified Nocardia TaxID=2637762 RepID=UPI0033CDAB8C
MAINFGPPESQSDEELLQHLAFWRRKVQEYLRTGQQDNMSQGRRQEEIYKAEAIRRGLIRPAEQF